MINIFGNAIVQNKDNCPDCKGSGEVWTWDDDYQGYVPSYCKCGVKIGDLPNCDLEEPDYDDREQIQPGDYRYYDHL